MPDIPSNPSRIDLFDFDTREQGMLEQIARTVDTLNALTLDIVAFIDSLPWTAP